MQKTNNDNQSKYFFFAKIFSNYLRVKQKNFSNYSRVKRKFLKIFCLRWIRWEKTEIKNRENNRKMEKMLMFKKQVTITFQFYNDNLFASIKTPQASDLYRTQLDLTNLLCFPFNSDYIVLCFYSSLPRSFGFF